MTPMLPPDRQSFLKLKDKLDVDAWLLFPDKDRRLHSLLYDDAIEYLALHPEIGSHYAWMENRQGISIDWNDLRDRTKTDWQNYFIIMAERSGEWIPYEFLVQAVMTVNGKHRFERDLRRYDEQGELRCQPGDYVWANCAKKGMPKQGIITSMSEGNGLGVMILKKGKIHDAVVQWNDIISVIDPKEYPKAGAFLPPMLTEAALTAILSHPLLDDHTKSSIRQYDQIAMVANDPCVDEWTRLWHLLQYNGSAMGVLTKRARETLGAEIWSDTAIEWFNSMPPPTVANQLSVAAEKIIKPLGLTGPERLACRKATFAGDAISLHKDQMPIRPLEYYERVLAKYHANNLTVFYSRLGERKAYDLASKCNVRRAIDVRALKMEACERILNERAEYARTLSGKLESGGLKAPARCTAKESVHPEIVGGGRRR